MKKEYINPDVSMISLEIDGSVLYESSELSEYSSLEGFEDDGDIIFW